MQRYPLNEIHYSDLSVYRQCPAKFFYMVNDRHAGTRPPVLLLGTLFHQAAEERLRWGRTWLEDVSADFWHEMIDNIRMMRPDEEYDCTERDIDNWCNKFVTRELFSGKTLGELVDRTARYIEALYTVEETELKLKYRDIYGLHVGTLDLLLKTRSGKYTIADIKTSGMWNKLLYGKSYTKQGATMEQITHHPQMRHYHWLGWRAGRYEEEEVSEYALVYPSNLIPYTKGPKAGKDRGNLIFGGNVAEKSIKRYEEDLNVWLQMIMSRLNVRTYPNTFGKIECPRCPWKNECLTDQSTSSVPEYLYE